MLEDVYTNLGVKSVNAVKSSTRTRQLWRQIGIYATLLLSSFTLGIFVSQMGVPRSESRSLKELPGQIAPVGDFQQHFVYNRTYSLGAVDSDTAWNALFPDHSGFFEVSNLEGGLAGLAVFHQLHCLDQIRKGFWSATQKALSHGEHVINTRHVNQLGHVMHCIDYLRVSLMCHADTNIEPLDTVTNGVKGFGTTHDCRDFERVRTWMNEQ